jgi:hypothetical protein
VTRVQNPHLPFHACSGLRGLTAPFLRVGVKAKVEAREREDYVGADAGNVTLDENGRPVMSIVTTRDDGQDCTAFAPCATAKVGIHA